MAESGPLNPPLLTRQRTKGSRWLGSVWTRSLTLRICIILAVFRKVFALLLAQPNNTVSQEALELMNTNSSNNKTEKSTIQLKKHFQRHIGTTLLILYLELSL